MEYLNAIIQNPETILTILGGLVVVASAIAPFTKTQVDDKAVGMGRKLLDRLSVLKDRVGSGARDAK